MTPRKKSIVRQEERGVLNKNNMKGDRKIRQLKIRYRYISKYHASLCKCVCINMNKETFDSLSKLKNNCCSKINTFPNSRLIYRRYVFNPRHRTLQESFALNILAQYPKLKIWLWHKGISRQVQEKIVYYWPKWIHSVTCAIYSCTFNFSKQGSNAWMHVCILQKSWGRMWYILGGNGQIAYIIQYLKIDMVHYWYCCLGLLPRLGVC